MNHHTAHFRAGLDPVETNDPIPASDPTIKYWWLERKSKRGEVWILESAFWATDENANNHLSAYSSRDGYEYRIREIQIGKMP